MVVAANWLPLPAISVAQDNSINAIGISWLGHFTVCNSKSKRENRMLLALPERCTSAASAADGGPSLRFHAHPSGPCRQSSKSSRIRPAKFRELMPVWRNWQTRWIQNPLGATPWRFKSSHRYLLVERARASQSNYPVLAGFFLCFCSASRSYAASGFASVFASILHLLLRILLRV